MSVPHDVPFIMITHAVFRGQVTKPLTPCWHAFNNAACALKN